MENLNSAAQGERTRPRAYRFICAVGVIFIAVLIAHHYLFSADPRCAAILGHPDSDVVLQVPVNCLLTAEAPTNGAVEYLESERKRRGLIFKQWIRCKTSNEGQPIDFAFTHDPHWLPSYVPGAYQFRQTVIIVPYGQRAAQRSPVAAQVCLMPRRRYASLIFGQCDGKFAIWK